VTAWYGDEAATQPYAAPAVPVPPKRIAVRGRPIRLRWAQQFAWSFIAANYGTLVIVTAYYLLVQWRWQLPGGHQVFLKPAWDHLFGWAQWPDDRHDIRNEYEAVLATLFVKSLLANWRKGGRYTRTAPLWYVAISPVLIVVAAAAPLIAGVALTNHVLPRALQRSPVHLPQQWAWLGTYAAGFPWQPIIIGVLTGLVVHRIYAPAGNTVNLYFVDRAVDKARDALAAGEPDPERHLPRWPVPPTIRERAAWKWTAGLPCRDRSRAIAPVVTVVMVLLTWAAAYGGYVKYVVAKGH
jgi:hypothetical protein